MKLAVYFPKVLAGTADRDLLMSKVVYESCGKPVSMHGKLQAEGMGGIL
ncbi:hypothetical protein [Mariprofundus ferrinatatus]|nr:hypothetical protein [Mariprofundus ferrinatatus]